MNEQYNLRKHPELFYLGENSFHVCPICCNRWACETILNYGIHDQSELIEDCYECNKSNTNQKNLGILPRFIVNALIESNDSAHRYADEIRREKPF